MLLAVPFTAFFAALILGHVLIERERRDWLVGLAVGMAGLGLWALWREGMAPGIDGLLYTLLLWGAVLPGLLALGLGAFVGWLDRRGALPA
jgi:hypothetical protein